MLVHVSACVCVRQPWKLLLRYEYLSPSVVCYTTRQQQYVQRYTYHCGFFFSREQIQIRTNIAVHLCLFTYACVMHICVYANVCVHMCVYISHTYS
jgi:hypothetical protein